MKPKNYMQCLLHVMLAGMIFLIFSSNVAFGQKNKQPRDVISDSTYTYIGWAGNPESITVYIDDTFSDAKKDSIRVAIQRWNNAGCVPALTEVTTGPANVTFTEGDPGVDPDTGVPNAGVYNWEMDANDKVVRGTIIIRNDSNPGLVETATHELGHALGLDDTDPNNNPSDVMKGSGPNGTNGELSPHDLSQLQSAAAVANTPVGAPPVEKVYCIDPVQAITPGGSFILSFELPFDYPPDAEYDVTPIANDLLFIEFVELFDNNLNIGVLTEPDHWSGQIYFDIFIFMYEGEPHQYTGVHYVNQNPVPPVEFDCLFNTIIEGNQVFVQWNGLHTYLFPDHPLRSILSVNGNQFYKVNPSADAPPGYYGDYTINLEPGIHELTLFVDDYQVNSASFSMDVFIEEPPPPPPPEHYFELIPNGKTNPENWYRWITAINGETSVPLLTNVPEEITAVRFYFSFDPATEIWTSFWEDQDGTSNAAPGEPGSYDEDYDGWCGYLYHEMLGDQTTEVFFKAEVEGLDGIIHEVFSEISLLYTLTPPSAFQITTNGGVVIDDIFVTDQPQLILQFDPTHDNFDYAQFQVTETLDSIYDKSIPHIKQPNDYYCGPAALAMCMKYFAGRDEMNMKDPTGGLSDAALMDSLAKYCGTKPSNGTTEKGMVSGSKQWIKKQGGGYTVQEFKKFSEFGIKEMEQHLLHDGKQNGVSQNIISRFRLTKHNGEIMDHYMTLSSVHKTDAGYNRFDYVDPSSNTPDSKIAFDLDENGEASNITFADGEEIIDFPYQKVELLSSMMICPNEMYSVLPGEQIVHGPDFPFVEIDLPEGLAGVRIRAVDNNGKKHERDILIRRVNPPVCPDDIDAPLGDQPFPLPVGQPGGGTFDGPHVDDDGWFWPIEEGIYPITYTVDYDGFVSSCEFIVMVIPYDFGDAPDPTYPTLLASDGARHIIDGATFLGQSVDPEPDGQPNNDATGDDNDGNNDDDGVIFGEIMVGSAAQVEVTTSVAGYLQGWIDFNADGDWDDPGEQIFIDEYIHFGQTVCLNYEVPADATPGLTFARFRFSTQPNISHSGLAEDGEVEDYQVLIIENPEHKWAQEPCEQLSGLHCHDYKIEGTYYFPELADDWLCNGGQVTEIQWWGNYETDDMDNEMRFSGIKQFQLNIFDHQPDGCLPVMQPVWTATVPLAAANETSTGLFDGEGGMIYAYSYTLQAPFEQIEGNQYWLAMSAVANDPVAPPHWRWQESSRSVSTVLCPVSSRLNNSPWQHYTWPGLDPVRFSQMAFSIVSGVYVPPEPPTATYLRPGEKTNPESWYAWISDPNGQTHVKLFANDPDRQIQTVEFFYKTDQTKEEWVLFDTDHDGFSYKAPGPNTGYQGEADGWSGYLPHTMIDQDELLTIEFMAHIITLNDEIITIDSETTLTYDPTPPSSFYLTVEDGFITDQDFLTIQLIPELANLNYVVFNVSGKEDEFQKNIPHTYQGDENSCGPHSLAACLKYFANEGYEGIDGGLDIGELAEELKTYVDNDDDEGAYDDEMAKGADEWIKEQGGGFTVTGPVVYEEFNTTRMREEFEGSALFNGIAQNIIPLFLWVEFNEETEQNDTLGHYMTLSSIHNTLEDGKRKLDFMDPANPGTNYIYGYVDEETGAVSGFGNHIPDGAWIESVIMICPDEPSPNPGGQGTIAEGPEPEPVELPMPTEGGVVIRTRAVDQDGHKAEKDITGTRVRPAEYPPGDIIVGLGEPPIILEGGIPAGGTYSGPHIINGIFHPVEIGIFLVTYTVVYPIGFVSECDFTITVIGYDFGDAPDDPYPTLLASDGARHVVGQALYLGQLIDPEPNGQPCPFALGDDQDGTDDEDGIRFLDSFLPGETVRIEATVNGTGYLNAWFDWDADGSWGGPFEHVIVNEQVNTGVYIFTINVPANASPGFTFARFRLTSQSGLSYKGVAPDGEVEDYRILINEPLGHKMHYPQYPDPAGWDVYMPTLQHIYQIGDDWMCCETGYVEDIHFWISWKDDMSPQNIDMEFNIQIYSGISASQSNSGYSIPGTILWQRTFAPGSYIYQHVFDHPQGWFSPIIEPEHLIWNHLNCYQVDIVNIPDPFLQEAGNIYWLVISAEVPPFKAGDEEMIILSLQDIDPQTQPYDIWHEQGFALNIQHHPFAPDLGFSLPPDGGVGLSPALLSLEPVDVNYTNADFLSHIEIDIIEFDAPGSTVAELYFDDELVGFVESTQMGAHTLVLENPMPDAGKQPVTVSFSLSIFGYDLLVAEVAIAYVALPVVNYQIGWKTSLDHFNDVAVLKNPFALPAHGWQLLLDPITQQPLSLAFVINGSPAEEPEIPEFLTIDDIIVPLGLDTCFNAEKTIYVHNLEILDGGRADFIAGESIIFYPGTKVHHGGEMWARITKDGTFCDYFNRHFLAIEPEVDSKPTTTDSEVFITDEVQEQPEAFFKLYPNPTRDRFTIELLHYEPGKPVTIEVYSMLGERILHEILPADRQHMLSLEAQHPGLYLVRVLQGDRTGVERLILR